MSSFETSLREIIKEIYIIGSLSESEQKLYYLISKYENKVSKRLLNKKLELYIKAEKMMKINTSSISSTL